jgi:hypothetical protein
MTPFTAPLSWLPAANDPWMIAPCVVTAATAADWDAAVLTDAAYEPIWREVLAATACQGVSTLMHLCSDTCQRHSHLLTQDLHCPCAANDDVLGGAAAVAVPVVQPSEGSAYVCPAQHWHRWLVGAVLCALVHLGGSLLGWKRT